MTTLYLDTEFNGFGGSLISIALFDPEGMDFYMALDLGAYIIDPWVAEHVIPVLGKVLPVPYRMVQGTILSYLARKPKPLVIVADWPADFEHLFRLMNTGAPWCVDIPLSAVLVSSPELHPDVPHNALSDAKALAEWHQTTLVPAFDWSALQTLRKASP